MNSKRLAKHYAKLTPLERLSLLTAAVARGDEVERDRLIRSAPIHRLHMPDCLPYAEAFTDLAKDYLILQLDAAHWYWRCAAAMSEADDGTSDVLFKALGLFAYQFVVRRQAWERLCEEYQIDAVALVGDSFAFESIEELAELMSSVACSAEEATAALRKNDDDATAATVEEVFEGMKRAIEQRAAQWA